MKPYIFLTLLISSFFSFAGIDHNNYEAIAWQNLKVENPVIKDVFKNTNQEMNFKDIVIPAYIVKSWMKDLHDHAIYFLSAQPYVCEHSQIPYANQMIKIINVENIEIAADNATPVYAFGNITIETNKAGLFSSAYTIELHDIQSYTLPSPTAQ